MDLQELMGKAQEMQAKMQEMQAEMQTRTVEGNAGGGMVKVTLNGAGEMKGVDIDPSIFTEDDKTMVEDLICAAYNDARRRVDSLMQEQAGQMMGGFQMPGGFPGM